MGYSDAVTRAKAERDAQDAQIRKEAASGVSARPLIPTFGSVLTPEGDLANKYRAWGASNVTAGQLNPADLAADPRALAALRDRALAPGASPWLKMQLEQQGISELTAADKVGATGNQQAAMARNALAMKGGLTSGASERAAGNAARDAALARNAVGRQGQVDRLGLNIADDTAKQAALGNVAGLDLQTAGQAQDLAKFNVSSTLDANKFNVGQTNDLSKFNAAAAAGGLQDQNTNKFGVYQEQMKGYAAGQTAAATKKSGKK